MPLKLLLTLRLAPPSVFSGHILFILNNSSYFNQISKLYCVHLSNTFSLFSPSSETSSLDQNESLSMCAISLEHRDYFCASPPFGFHIAENTGRMVCEDSSVIVLVRDTKFEGRDVVIEV